MAEWRIAFGNEQREYDKNQNKTQIYGLQCIIILCQHTFNIALV